MTIPTSPARLQLTEEQYVADLTSLLRRYKLRCGSPACLRDLGSQLETNSALRGDLFTLCTAISHMGESDLSPEELLALVARAAGGTPYGSREPEIPSATRNLFLTLHERWSNRIWDEMTPPDPEEPPIASAPAEADWKMPIDPFATAAARASAGLASANRSSADHSVDRSVDRVDGTVAARSAITADTRLGELTISELRTYLDDIEHRVGRLQPYFAAVLRTGEGTAPEGPPDTLPETLPAPADEQHQDAAARHQEAAAGVADASQIPAEATAGSVPMPADSVPLHVEETPATLAPRASGEAQDSRTEAAADPDGPKPAATAAEAASRSDTEHTPAVETVQSPAPADTGAHAAPVVLLPLRTDPRAAAEPAMFRSVSEDSDERSPWLAWLTAAILILGAGAGYEYWHLYHRPAAPSTVTTAPAPAVPSAADATPAPPVETPQAPAPQEVAPETKIAPATPPPAVPRRHRPYGSQPRLLPHEVQMEAEAARAGAAAAATLPDAASGTGPASGLPSGAQPRSAGAKPGTSTADPNQPQ